MMNDLKITLNPYEEFNTASLDGKTLSPYSEISNYIKMPLLDWAGKLLCAAEREINDDFSLTVVGEKFEKLLFNVMAQSFSDCTDFHTGKFSVDFLVEKRYAVMKKLALKYGMDCSLSDFAIKAFSDVPVAVDRDAIVAAELHNSFLVVTKDIDLAKNISSLSEVRVAFIVSDKCLITYTDNGKYLWEIPESDLAEAVSAVIERFVKIPFIIHVAKKLKACKQLEHSDKEMLELAISVEPLVKVENIGRIEVGDSVELKIKAFPQGSALPDIRIETNNASVVEINGLRIKAIAPGEAEINVYKSDEIIPFAKKKVTTFKDNSIKRIILDRKEPNMGIGKSQKIELSVLPADAADSNYIVWSVDNPQIASIDDNGVITAKSHGRVVVTASTSKVSESVIIDILPNITKLHLSVGDVQILKGDSMPISVISEPSNCYNNCYHWTTNDSNVAYVETLSDGSSFIRTKEPGTCTITCVADEGDCTSSFNVEVVDPDEIKAKMKKSMSSLDIACIVGVPIGVAILLLIIFGIIGIVGC